MRIPQQPIRLLTRRSVLGALLAALAAAAGLRRPLPSRVLVTDRGVCEYGGLKGLMELAESPGPWVDCEWEWVAERSLVNPAWTIYTPVRRTT